MSGAWETSGNPSMLIAIPNTDIVTTQWALEFAAMWKPHNVLLRGWSGMPIDIARNVFVNNAREMKVKYLLYMDSDVLPIKNDWIRMLMDAQQPIISGLYWSKKGHPSIWLKNRADPPDKQTYSPIVGNFPGAGIVEVDAVGAGALLIDMRVFDTIDKVLGPQPYFVWQWVDPEHLLPGQKSEDFYFCDLAQRAGFSILCHTGVELFHEQTIAWDIHGVISKVES